MNIKEIEERSGLTRANIRYYEQEGLIAPARRENKYRDYSEEDLETLLRVALLRSLGFSLDEIRRLQSGELELAAAMRERSAALESEGQRLLAARNVCDAISREVTSYSALRPEDYLNGFEPDAAAKQRDVAEPHPLRRYLARAIDLTLTGILVSFVQFMLLHHNLVNISKAEIFLCGLAGWGLLVLIEPLLLSRFAATAGKWCMGITVTRPDGERLSYGEALERTAAVWLYGAGLGIPENEELVLEQIHLQDGLLDGHGRDVELLVAHDLEFFLPRVVRGDLEGFDLTLYRTITQPLLKARLVLAYLPLDARNGGIDGGIHVAGQLAHAVEHSVVLDGHLGAEASALRAEGHEGLALRLEKPVYLANLLLGIGAQLLGGVHLLFRKRELHWFQLLPAYMGIAINILPYTADKKKSIL